MTDEPVFSMSESVSPQTKGPLPSGIRLGLQGSLDADDMARRMLGTVIQAPPAQEYPEDKPSTFPATLATIFDLKEVLISSFSVYARGSKDKGVFIYDETMTVAPGSFVYDAVNDKWTISGIIQSVWVYLLVDMVAKTVTLKCENALPSDTTDIVIKPLYFLPWDTGNAKINQALIVDFRHSVIVSKEDAQLPYTNFYILDNSASPPTIAFSAGSVIWGKLPAMTVGNATAHTALDGYYWGIRMTYDPATATASAAWVSSASVSAFVDTDTSVAMWYYKLSVTAGVASVVSVAKVGDWKIPSIFAPEV